MKIPLKKLCGYVKLDKTEYVIQNSLIWLNGIAAVYGLLKATDDQKRSLRRKRTLEEVNNRNVRAIPAFVVPAVKMIGYTAGIIAGGAAVSAIDIKMREYAAIKAEERLRRKIITCDQGNYGCIQNICWTNCGPRLDSSDWCFTTKNVSKGLEKRSMSSVRQIEEKFYSTSTKTLPI